MENNVICPLKAMDRFNLKPFCNHDCAWFVPADLPGEEDWAGECAVYLINTNLEDVGINFRKLRDCSK